MIGLKNSADFGVFLPGSGNAIYTATHTQAIGRTLSATLSGNTLSLYASESAYGCASYSGYK